MHPKFSLLATAFIFLAVILPSMTSAQHHLHETDTALHYKEIFFINGKLNVSPSFSYFDSTLNTRKNISKDSFDLGLHNLDTSKIVLLREGTWKNVNKDKGKEAYALASYVEDELVGKMYHFDNRDNLIKTFTRYPRIIDTIFYGSQITSYNRKGRITSIKYILFNEDQTNLIYWHYLTYSKLGNLIQFTFMDEGSNLTRFITYSEEGEIIEDYKIDATEKYKRKWNKNRTKLKEELYEKSKRTIRYYRDGELVKEKAK